MSLRASSSELSKFGVQPDKKSVLGQVKYFEDGLLETGGEIVKRLLSNWAVEAVLVVNNTGSALLPGQRVEWDTSTDFGVGLGVDGVAPVDDRGAGIVSHLLPSTGVPDGATFWLIRRGPCNVRAAAGSFTTGNDIFAVANGRVAEAGTVLLGRIAVTDGDAADDDLLRAFIDFRL